jgi:hypothetical protein
MSELNEEQREPYMLTILEMDDSSNGLNEQVKQVPYISLEMKQPAKKVKKEMIE